MKNNKKIKDEELEICKRYIRGLRELAYLNRIFSKLKKYDKGSIWKSKTL